MLEQEYVIWGELHRKVLRFIFHFFAKILRYENIVLSTQKYCASLSLKKPKLNKGLFVDDILANGGAELFEGEPSGETPNERQVRPSEEQVP
jgi:hypothetical protein